MGRPNEEHKHGKGLEGVNQKHSSQDGQEEPCKRFEHTHLAKMASLGSTHNTGVKL